MVSKFMDNKQNLGFSWSQSRSSLESDDDPPDSPLGGKNFGNWQYVAILSAVDRKMEEYTHNLLQAVDRISVRMVQLESRTRQLENSIDELKNSAQYYHDSTHRKLIELEAIAKQVEGGIRDLRDQREIAEAQFQLTRLQLSGAHFQSKNVTKKLEKISGQQASLSVPQKNDEQPPSNYVSFPQHADLPSNVSPNLHHRNPSHAPIARVAPLPLHLGQNQFPSVQNIPETYYPSDVLNPSYVSQQYLVSPTQVSALPRPPSIHQKISHSDQPPLLHPPPNAIHPQGNPLTPQHVGRKSCMTSEGHSPSIPMLLHAPHAISSAQLYHVDSHPSLNDYSSGSSFSNFPSEFPQFGGEPNLHTPPVGSPFQYLSSATKPFQSFHSSSVQGDDFNHSRLHTVKTLPHALPMASDVDSGSSSDNGMPIEVVVDIVVAMGFRRDRVRATVKKLTENGQSVDPNLVLDKLLMSSDEEVQRQQGRNV